MFKPTYTVSNICTFFLFLTFQVSLLGQCATSPCIFTYTGSEQSWTVPAGVTSIIVQAWGAQGGPFTPGGVGGLGGYVEAEINVIPGQELLIYIGGEGIESGDSPAGGFNGGGGVFSYSSGGMSGTGGGATDIRLNNMLSSRLIVAGGGGGAGGYSSNILNGGDGGGMMGMDGVPWPSWPDSGGKGGSDMMGGAQGVAGLGSCSSYTTDGSLGMGGFGAGNGAGGGGGGSGYFGGGGSCFGGGGGGSSYVVPSGIVINNEQGARTGNGELIISFEVTAAVPTISEWGVLILLLLLVIFGTVYMKFKTDKRLSF